MSFDCYSWREVTLGDLADFINGDRGKNYPGVVDRVEFGVPFINTGHILPSGRLSNDEMDYITRDKYNQLGSGKVRSGDIVYCLRGSTIGKTARNHFEEGAIASSLVIVRAKAGVNQDYLYYFLTSPRGQQLAKENDNGSAQPNLSAKLLSKYPLRVPSYEQQTRIVGLLNAIDNKIEINTQTNQTLEQMAQAIFKSWFVDFDPVKAKMNGEQPEGMDEATAALFPDQLVESELGLIPEGWVVSTLSNLINLIGGGTPKRSEDKYWNGEIPWFSVKDIPSGSDVFVVDTDEKITELGLQKSSTKLLPKGTTIITARGTVGKLALVGTDMCMNQSCYGIRGKDVGDYYNYFNLKEAVSTLQRNTHGAVFDTITTKTFDTYSMAFGGVELANKFDVLISPLLHKIESNVRENIELSALRDTLLPRLLSGEIELERCNDECITTLNASTKDSIVTKGTDVIYEYLNKARDIESEHLQFNPQALSPLIEIFENKTDLPIRIVNQMEKLAAYLKDKIDIDFKRYRSLSDDVISEYLQFDNYAYVYQIMIFCLFSGRVAYLEEMLENISSDNTPLINNECYCIRLSNFHCDELGFDVTNYFMDFFETNKKDPYVKMSSKGEYWTAIYPVIGPRGDYSVCIKKAYDAMASILSHAFCCDAIVDKIN